MPPRNQSATGLKQVVLTFDDGPNPTYTNQILEILKKEEICATFFVCGANAEKHPDLVKKIAQSGHQIGNHSFSHSFITTVLGTNFAEIIKTQNIIATLVPQKEKFYKGPWGITPFWLTRKLKSEGFKIIPVDATPLDWVKSAFGLSRQDWVKGIAHNEIAQETITRSKGGTIITLHDAEGLKTDVDRSRTVEALKAIIKTLKAKGFHFVNLDEIAS